MKLTNWDAATKTWSSRVVAESVENFYDMGRPILDRLNRLVGAGYYISEEVYVDAGETSASYSSVERNPCLVGGPGTYYDATTYNTRNGKRYQSTTSVLCASREAAQRYCDAYMTRKAKDAHKKSGK